MECVLNRSAKDTRISRGNLRCRPLSLELQEGCSTPLVVFELSFKEETKIEEEAGEDESTWWEETFGGNTDTKPRGPEAISLDISFPGYEHVFGIPEHATRLSLKTTRYVRRNLLKSQG